MALMLHRRDGTVAVKCRECRRLHEPSRLAIERAAKLVQPGFICEKCRQALGMPRMFLQRRIY